MPSRLIDDVCAFFCTTGVYTSGEHHDDNLARANERCEYLSGMGSRIYQGLFFTHEPVLYKI